MTAEEITRIPYALEMFRLDVQWTFCFYTSNTAVGLAEWRHFIDGQCEVGFSMLHEWDARVYGSIFLYFEVKVRFKTPDVDLAGKDLRSGHFRARRTHFSSCIRCDVD